MNEMNEEIKIDESKYSYNFMNDDIDDDIDFQIYIENHDGRKKHRSFEKYQCQL